MFLTAVSLTLVVKKKKMLVKCVDICCDAIKMQLYSQYDFSLKVLIKV